MNRTQDALKKVAVNGRIPEKEAMEIGKQSDELLSKSVMLMAEIEKAVGMYLGGKITTLISEITHVKSGREVYFYEKEPDGQ